MGEPPTWSAAEEANSNMALTKLRLHAHPSECRQEQSINLRMTVHSTLDGGDRFSAHTSEPHTSVPTLQCRYTSVPTLQCRYTSVPAHFSAEHFSASIFFLKKCRNRVQLGQA
ncbi:hypothetical protein GPALN_004532 [Globodera pallida]|nr:hypothetical protein GPALN_004532 [Globodera pallida]